MALKLNIRPDLEAEINTLLVQAQIRSKTEYINLAIEAFNHSLKRRFELSKLASYFNTYRRHAKDTLHDFATLRHA